MCSVEVLLHKITTRKNKKEKKEKRQSEWKTKKRWRVGEWNGKVRDRRAPLQVEYTPFVCYRGLLLVKRERERWKGEVGGRVGAEKDRESVGQKRNRDGGKVPEDRRNNPELVFPGHNDVVFAAEKNQIISSSPTLSQFLSLPPSLSLSLSLSLHTSHLPILRPIQANAPRT